MRVKDKDARLFYEQELSLEIEKERRMIEAALEEKKEAEQDRKDTDQPT